MLPKMIIHNDLWDGNSMLLLLWGISYFWVTAFFYASNSWANEIGYLLGPVVFYQCGRLFTYKLRNQKMLLWMILLICLCSALTIFIMTITDITNGEIIAYDRRFAAEDDAILSATLYGLIAAISLSGLGYFISTGKNSPLLLNIAFLGLFIGSLLTTIHLINRTGIVIALFCTFSIIFLQGRQKAGRAILLLSIIVIVAIAYTGTDWLTESIEAYNYRNTNGLGIESGGGRFDRWMDALSKFMFYPFGWWLDNNTYNAQVHNLWLDVARVGGIIPFFLIIIITFRIIRTQILLLKDYKTQPIIILTFGILFCMVLASSVEPVIEAKICYLCLLIFFAGIERQLYSDRKILF